MLSRRGLLLILPFVAVTWLQWMRTVSNTTIQAAGNAADPTKAALRLVRTSKIVGDAPKPGSRLPQPANNMPRQGEAVKIAFSSADTQNCPLTRKPYHTILTATAQVYQQWQSRIMFQHWKKMRDTDPAGACTELTGFTRLVASPQGRPDGLEQDVPSVFVKEYDGVMLAKFHGYRVVNRPYSIVQFINDGGLRSISESYLFIAETDHILLQPIPNKAERGSPMAYIFGYMGPNPSHAQAIYRVWPEGGQDGFKSVQSIGPSPIIIHKDDLVNVSQPWNDISVKLKLDREADSKLGWVIEMWGYAIAAASIKLKHQEYRDFQVEPGGLSGKRQLENFQSRYWIFHYTYQFELMLDGTACKPWTIGEYSLDKRHFSDVYPPYPLPDPPAKANEAAFFLVKTFNDAMRAIPNWPSHQPESKSNEPQIQSLYGRRRLDWFTRHTNGFQTELKSMSLIQKLAGTSWECGEVSENHAIRGSLKLSDTGEFFSRSEGRWASMNDPSLGDLCPIYSCIFIGTLNAHVAGDDLSKLILLTQPATGLVHGKRIGECSRR